LFVLKHDPLQFVVPVGHPVHTPRRQVSPAAHALPHVPQLFSSVSVTTHAPPQFRVPVGHAITHVPAPHAWNAPHTLPQLPQLRGSV
jgi:hypothetical protein